MRLVHLASGLAVVMALLHGVARADVGWSEEKYNQTYGPGQRGFAKTNERAYKVGDSQLVVELTPDNSASTGELWVLGSIRDGVPAPILEAGAKAEKGTPVTQVHFKAKSALTAEIREATVDGALVRVDVRNNLVSRIALCGPPPTCSLWRRIFGPACETTVSCSVLDRALTADTTMDAFHVRMEQAAERSAGH